jgi:hypothetical protein
MNSWLVVFPVGAATKLVQELDSRFPTHQLMEALGMVYPQYWCIEECRVQVIKTHYCHPKSTQQKKKKLKRKATALLHLQLSMLATSNSTPALQCTLCLLNVFYSLCLLTSRVSCITGSSTTRKVSPRE